MRGSAEYYAACFRERKLEIGSVQVAGYIAGAGCTIPVVAIENQGPGQLRMTLDRPRDDGQTPSYSLGWAAPRPETFEVRAYLQADGEYLAIATCDWRAENDPPPVYLVELRDGTLAAPRDDAKVDRVARSLIDRLERWNRGGHFTPLTLEPGENLAPIARRLIPQPAPLIGHPTGETVIVDPPGARQFGQTVPPGWRVCPSCSSVVQPDHRYCGHYGTLLTPSS